MKVRHAAFSAFAAAAIGLASCSDALQLPAFLNDSIIEADMAASAGDAIAAAIADMATNEAQAGLQSESDIVSFQSMSAIDPTYTRVRTCHDANDAVVANCTPLNSVRRIVTHVTFDGTRTGSSTGSGGVTTTWTSNVHFVADDTLQRIFNTAQPPVETSRRHSGIFTGNDTVAFTQGEFSRNVTANSSDSVQAVTWNMPRTQNPFPVSGRIVRMANWRIEAAGESRSYTREVSRRIVVEFPADAQGNVVLRINNLTCSLNLVTRVVSNCE